MIEVTNIRAGNFENAFRGMRNSWDSWENSDSWFGIINPNNDRYEFEAADKWADFIIKKENLLIDDQEQMALKEDLLSWICDNCILYSQTDSIDNMYEVALIGPEDMKLATDLIEAGSSHSKFLRQIFISMDIDAPIYWWKEMDTYKVATTANSTSTMHTLAKYRINKDFFSFDEDVDEKYVNQFITYLEDLRLRYIETRDKKYWRELIQLLPESWNQLRTWTGSYQNLRNIYSQRKSHKLVEWRDFCKVIENDVPWGKQLPCYGLLPDSNK